MPSPPRAVLQTELVTIVDELLPPAAVDGLWNLFQLQPFRRVDELGMQGQWALEDSAVLRGPTTGFGRRFDAQYPTKTPLDALIKAIADAAPLFAGTAGARDGDWKSFSACPTIHVAGQGRLWHRDDGDDSASLWYFAHPTWNVEWGGELFIADADERTLPAELGAYLHRLKPMPDHPDPPAWKSHLDNDDVNRLLLERGLGTFVAPKPNRLVVIRSTAARALGKVRPSAGRNVHAAVTGAFKR